MEYFFKLLFFLININQEIILNWFESENLIGEQIMINPSNSNSFNVEELREMTIGILSLLIEDLVNKLQDGLTMVEIENFLFFILFIRFIILAVRYNLKTSFYITCIGIFAGYLWYKHLVDIISTYSNVLIKVPLLQNFGENTMQAESMIRQGGFTNSKLGENAHWYQPGEIIYVGIMRGIVNIDSETGQRYFIDPFSMIISKFQGSGNSDVVELYYQLYKKIIPKVYEMASKFWGQLSGIAAYATITRIGKRYCPYLIRWHWTFLLVIMMIEQIFITFINRANYFQTQVLIPQKEAYDNYINSSLEAQIGLLNFIIGSIVLAHIGFLIFGLFHAIWGQYFYFPFLVENTELHVGPRPTSSIYSGGYTSWQDPAEKKNLRNRRFPKVWYGWFGSGTQDRVEIRSQLKNFFNKIIKNFRRQFRQ